MNFISFSYLLFLPVTMLLSYLLPARWRNPALLACSYFFYVCWKPVYALFLLLSTITTYFCARLTERDRRRLWMVLTLVLNFGLLLLFKYLNFFLLLGGDLLGLLGLQVQPARLELLLPVGISFYTFQAAGYIIDVYRGEYPAERSFLDYALFVSFFPQIVSGPIGRGGSLLPQLKAERRFSDENLKSGCLRILWGMAKKMLVADYLAVMVNTAFSDVQAFTPGQLAVAAVCYTFQIYCDFSSYTDIAIGSARLLGIELMENFRCPYAARSIKEFWRRWHISLSTWFRDYLYFPLGGSRRGKLRTCLNVLIVFAVSGLWHGAAMTFVVWGLLHGLFQVAGILLKPVREKVLYRILPREHPVMKALAWLGTFALVTAAWVFFRADTLHDGFYVIRSSLVWLGHLSIPAVTELGVPRYVLKVVGLCLLLLCVVDLLKERYDVAGWFLRRDWARYGVYFIIICTILIYGYYGNNFDPQDFVYFKF